MIAAIFILLGLSMSGIMIGCGYALFEKRKYKLCKVLAIAECVVFPYGTLLGVLLLTDLARPEGKAFFQESSVSERYTPDPWVD